MVQADVSSDFKRKVGIAGNVQLDAKSRKIDHAGFLDGNGSLRHKRSSNPGKRYSKFTAVTGACMAIRRATFFSVEEWTRAERVRRHRPLL